MDREKANKFTAPLLEVYLGIEEQLLQNIVKRIKRTGSLLEEIENSDGDPVLITAWQVEALAQLGGLTQEQIRTIARESGKTADEIKKMLEQAGYSLIDEVEDILQEGVDRGILRPPEQSARRSKTLKEILLTFEEQARDTFNLVNSTLIEQAGRQYVGIVNRTVGVVLSGAATPKEAIRVGVRELAEKGIPALVDKAGRQWSTEAYLSMVTRSMSNEIANRMQDARFDEMGVDLVEVSSHAGARPLCAPYQGRVYSRSGKHPNYPALSDTSIGHPAGLFGINCRHVKYPYFEGSRRTYKPYPEEENDRIYKESQKQRYLERRIRHAKRELKLMQTLGDEKGVEEAKAKVRQRQEAMREFIKNTGRTRRYDREQIVT